MLKFLITIVFLGWLLWFAYSNFDEAFGPRESVAVVMCPDDVGFCPDGSTTERSGPSCAFAACP